MDELNPFDPAADEEVAHAAIDARAQSAEALVAGVSAVVALVAGVVAWLLKLAGTQGFGGLFALIVAVYSALLAVLARNGLLEGGARYPVIGGLVSFPTFGIVAAELTPPGGAAQHLSGMWYAYFHVIIVSGSMFAPRVEGYRSARRLNGTSAQPEPVRALAAAERLRARRARSLPPPSTTLPRPAG